MSGTECTCNLYPYIVFEEIRSTALLNRNVNENKSRRSAQELFFRWGDRGGFRKNAGV